MQARLKLEWLFFAYRLEAGDNDKTDRPQALTVKIIKLIVPKFILLQQNLKHTQTQALDS